MDAHYRTIKIAASAMLGIALVFCPNLIAAPPSERIGYALGCFSLSMPILGFVVATVFLGEIEASRDPERATKRLLRFDTLISFATIVGAAFTVLGLWFSFQHYSIEHGFAFIASCALLTVLWIYIHRS
jgi:predicted cation transporter